MKTALEYDIFIARRDNPMTKLKYNLKSDTLFKMLFTRNQDLLKRLVAALLGIKYEDITAFNVINPEISPFQTSKNSIMNFNVLKLRPMNR